jgi:hypothetical protein
MLHTLIANNPTDDLAYLAEQLDTLFYKEITFICTNGLNYIGQVIEIDGHGAMALNLVLCEQIIGEVMDMIAYKQKNFTGYLFQLSEKQAGEHDCRSCSGKCHMEHGLQLHSMKDYNKKLEPIIYRLQSEGIPLHDIDYPQLYGTVRSQMTNLEQKLRELFAYEEKILLPGVVNAQKAINVHP